MNREQLFTGVTEPKPVQGELGEFDRSPLEGYVTTEMPLDLEAARDGRMSYEELATKQTGILEGATLQMAFNTVPHVAHVTQMDMLLMFGGYIPSGEDMYRNAPPALMSRIHQQSDLFGIEPYMTYEMIVDLNAQEYHRTGEMRTFTTGTTGQHERDFYLGHYLAEPYARSAAYKLHALAEGPELMDAERILVDAKTDLDEFKLHMGAYNRLPKDEFAAFRPYLAGYADGTRNASGAFMPSVQLLELALVSPTDQYGVYLDESEQYFPGWARPVIQSWRELSTRGVTIEGMLAEDRLDLTDTAREALLGVIDSFINFRMAHLGITKAQIPEAFSSLDSLKRKDIAAQLDEDQIIDPRYKGTAGFDVRNVLTNSVYRRLKLRERIDGSVGAEEA